MSQKPKGIAARAGRWSAQHRKTAILLWLALVIGAFYLGGPFGTGTKTAEQSLPGDAGRAQKIQDDAFPDSTTGAGGDCSRRGRQRPSGTRHPGCGRDRPHPEQDAQGR